MQTQIKTHRIHRTYNDHHFFILAKGNNAGKPLDHPCPNCFVVIAKDQHERYLLYWLCFGLWQSGFFKCHLIGSVIPFLRLPALKSILQQVQEKVQQRKDEFDKAVVALNDLQRYHQTIVNQVEVICQMKKCVMAKLLR